MTSRRLAPFVLAIAAAACASAPQPVEPAPELPAWMETRGTRPVAVRGLPWPDGTFVEARCDTKGGDPVIQRRLVAAGRIDLRTPSTAWWWRFRAVGADGGTTGPVRRAVLVPPAPSQPDWWVATGPGDRVRFHLPARADGGLDLGWDALADE